MSFVVLNANAYDIDLGNYFYYNVVDLGQLTVSLTHYSDYTYGGHLDIEPTIEYKGKTWTVVEIGESAFGGHYKLESVTIPNTVTTIRRCAFWACSNLVTVSLPNSLISIEDRVFEDCQSLRSIKLPDSIAKIGSRAFLCCYGLETVTLPNSIEVIGDDAFWACRSLSSISFPGSLKELGTMAFYACHNLREIIFQHSMTHLMLKKDNANHRQFEACDNIEHLYIGRCIASDGNPSVCFWPQDFWKVKKITIDANFSGNLPSFCTFPSLSEIESQTTNPSNINAEFLNKHYLNATLYVPKGTKEIYETVEGWKNFFTIVEKDIEIMGLRTPEYKVSDKAFYNIRGEKLSYLRRGLNIIVKNNGESKKVIIK